MIHHLSFAAFTAVLAFSSFAMAQDKVVPEFLTLQRQYDAQVKGAVELPFQVAFLELNQKYSAALEREVKAAQQRGRLSDVLPFAAERSRADKGEPIPEQDDDTTPAVLKQMRASYRASLAKLTAEKERKIKPLTDGYSKSLTALVATLTKSSRISDADFVEQQRLDLQSDPAFRSFKGTWVVSYTPNVRSTRRYRFNAYGQVEYVVNDKVESTIRITRKGRDYLLDFGDGKLERISMKEGKLHIDHFNPATRYPDAGPSHLGTGQKVG